jgi:hypothetical protein
MKAVRNGSCSMGAVALEDLEVDEAEAEDAEEELVVLAARKSGQSNGESSAGRYIQPHSSC